MCIEYVLICVDEEECNCDIKTVALERMRLQEIE